MKKAIIISSLLVASAFFLSKEKVKTLLAEYEIIFKQLKIKLAGIRELKIANKELKANVILTITNPTTTDLGVDTNSYIALNKLFFYTENGKFIGTAYPEISNIQLPAGKILTTPEIPVIVPISPDVFLSLLINSQNIQVKAEIKALNTTYTI